MAEAKIQISADVANLSSGIKSAITDLDALKRKQDELNQSIDSTVAKRAKGQQTAANNIKKEAAEQQKQIKIVDELGKEYDELGKARKKANNTDGSTKINKSLRGTSKQLGATTKATRGFGGALQGVGGRVGKFLTSPIGLAIGAVAGLGAVTVKAIGVQRKFQSSLADLQAITGATTEDLEFYRDTAREIASDRTLSTNINETVNAFKLVGSAKPELLEVKEELAEVTEQAILLSKASGDTLDSSVNSLTATLNQFNLGADQAATVTNALAAGSKFGAAAVPAISDAITKFGVAANSSNISVFESIGAIETLAEKGLQGAEAGTQLRNVFNKLSATDILPKAATDRLVQAGVDVSALSDQSLTLEERLEALAPIQNDANALTAVFGAESKNAAQILLQNTSTLGAYTQQVQTQGVAQEQASIRTNTFDGALTRLSNSFTALLAGGGGLLDLLAPLINFFADLLDSVTEIADAFADWDLQSLTSGFLDLANTLTFGLIPALDDAAGELNRQIARQERLQKVQDEATAEINKQAKGFNELITVLKTSQATDDQKAKAVEALKNQYGDLVGEIDLTTASIDQLNTVQKEANKQIIQNAIARQKQIILEKSLQAQIQRSQDILTGQDAIANLGTIGKIGEDLQEARQQEVEDAIKNSQRVAQENIAAIEEIEKTFLDAEEAGNSFLASFGGGVETADQQLKQSREAIGLAGDQIERLVGEELAGQILKGGNRAKEALDQALRQTSDTDRLLAAYKDVQTNLGIAAGAELALGKTIRDNVDASKGAADAAEDLAGASAGLGAAASAASSGLSKAAELAEKRLELLQDARDQEADIFSDLLERQLDIQADTAAKQIKLKQDQSLEELKVLEQQLVDQRALLLVEQEFGQEFIEKATQAELDAELAKFNDVKNLTEEQSLAISVIRQDIYAKTASELRKLELENQIELLSIQETSANERFEILEKQEARRIEEINNLTTLSEEQKQLQILDIQATFNQNKIDLINEEFEARQEQVRDEILLLEEAGDEISLARAAQLENTLTLNQLERDETIDGINEQVEATKTAIQELQDLTVGQQIDGIIGSIFGTDNPDEIQTIKDTFQDIVTNVVDIYKQGINQQIEAQQQLINAIDDQIAKQEEAVDKQLQLQQDGNANSLSAEQQRLSELKAQREQAIAEQEALQEKQLKIERAQQAAALITASANVFKSLAGVPGGIILAAGLVATLVAQFVKSQQTISAATSNIQFEKGGVIQGKRHSQGGEMLLDHVEVEAGEQVSVLSRRATSRYGGIMKQITNDFNAGRMPSLPSSNAINFINVAEQQKFENEFNKAVNKKTEMLLSKNNDKMDELIAAFKNQPNRYTKGSTTIEKRGSTIKRKS